jgi:hypothetical protein
MSTTLTPAELLAQLINSANAAKAKIEADALAAKTKLEAEQAEAKKLADALVLASAFERVHTASVDRLVELEKAATTAKAKADAETFIVDQVKNNFASAQGLLNEYDVAKKQQETNIAEKSQLDMLSNFLKQQMTERGL